MWVRRSTRSCNPVLAPLVSVPWTRTLPLLIAAAPASTGELWPSFAPPFNAMPSPPFVSIEFCLIVVAVAAVDLDAVVQVDVNDVAGPIVFPKLIDSMAAPSFVFVTVLPKRCSGCCRRRSR